MKYKIEHRTYGASIYISPRKTHEGKSSGTHCVVLTPLSNPNELLSQVNYQLSQDGCEPITSDEWSEATSGYFASVSEQTRAEFLASITQQTQPQNKLTQSEYANAVESRFDKEAQELGYDSVAKATTYVSSLNAKFAAEARHFIALRDACWLLCFAALENPPAVKPTPAEFAEDVVTQALAEVGQPIYS